MRKETTIRFTVNNTQSREMPTLGAGVHIRHPKTIKHNKLLAQKSPANARSLENKENSDTFAMIVKKILTFL